MLQETITQNRLRPPTFREFGRDMETVHDFLKGSIDE